MAAKCDVPTFKFKRGDDFKLDFTAQSPNNTISLALADDIEAAQLVLEEAQNAEPIVPQDIIDAQAVLDAAQAAYDISIIINITDWAMAAQIRRGTKLINDLVIVIIDAATGRFSITCDAVLTADWPVQKLECDIEFVRPTGKVSSETFNINVQRDITQ